MRPRWGFAVCSLLVVLWCLGVHGLGCAPGTAPSYGIATGKVVEEATGAGLPGAFVVLAGHETGTDSEGVFEIERIDVPESGEWSLSASLDGYRTYDAAFSFSSPGDLALELAPVDNRDTAGTLDGAIVSATDGTPLGPAKVTVSTLVGETVVDTQTTHSSTAGNWQMSGVSIGQCRVETTMPGWLPDLREVYVYPGQGSNRILEIELVEGTSRVTVTGRVFDVETQAVLAGAVVGDDESARTVTTDADGAFSLPGVLVGTRTFRATATGYDPTFVTTMILGTPEPVAIGMARSTGGPPVAPGTVGGRVTLADDGSPAGVRVALYRAAGGAQLESRTLDETGVFGFFVAPGAYKLVVSLSGYQTAQVPVAYAFGVPVRNLWIELEKTP